MKGAKKRAKNFVNKKDGTYDALTGKSISYDDGFQVSFVRPEAFAKLDDEAWDELAEYIMEKTGSAEHVGVYEGVAETSFHCNTAEEAREFMYQFNQDSIFIWANKIYLGTKEWYKAFEFNRVPEKNRPKETDYDKILQAIRANTK